MSREARVRGLVVEVLAEALRERGLQGLVTGAPPSPEEALLRRWVTPELHLVILAPGDAEAVTSALQGSLEEGWMAAARARARREHLLVVHPANKLTLLLAGAPEAPCYPLGDLWPQDVGEWAGRASLPPVLSGLSVVDVQDVEDRLRRGLEGGLGVRKALEDLRPSLAGRVASALRAGARSARPPLVPKLTAWTAGLDPGP